MPSIFDDLQNLFYGDKSVMDPTDYSGNDDVMAFTQPGSKLIPKLLRDSFQKRVGELTPEVEGAGPGFLGQSPLPNFSPPQKQETEVPDATNPQSPLEGMPVDADTVIQTPDQAVPTASPIMPGKVMAQGIAYKQDTADADETDYMKEFAKELREQKNDMFRMALLKAGTAMMGTGTFSEQLARGAQGFEKGISGSKEDQLKNLALLAGVQAKGKGQEGAMQRALIQAATARAGLQQRAQAAQAKGRAGVLSNPLIQLQDAQREALTQQVLKDSGIDTPARNIAGKTGSIPEGAIDYLKKHPDTADKFEKTFGVSADEYLQ